jgi:hypothetical protein
MLDGRWMEQAICSSREQASHVMKAMAAQNPRG